MLCYKGTVVIMKEIYLNDNDFSNLKFTILSKDLEGTLLLKQGSYYINYIIKN